MGPPSLMRSVWGVGAAVGGCVGEGGGAKLRVLGWLSSAEVMVLSLSSDTSLINLHILCRSAHQDAVN